MMNIRKSFAAIAFWFPAIVLGSAAHATTVIETYTGNVTSGTYAGDAYTVTFTIDTAIGSAFTNSIPLSASTGITGLPQGSGIVGGSAVGSASPVNATFSIAGVGTYAISGNYAGAAYNSLTVNSNIVGAVASGSHGYNGPYITVSDFSEAPQTAGYLQSGATFWNVTEANLNPYTYGYFAMGEVVNGVGESPSISGDLGIASVSVSAVPLPETLPLFAAAIMGLSMVCLRKKANDEARSTTG
jgi:hypothetical protein